MTGYEQHDPLPAQFPADIGARTYVNIAGRSFLSADAVNASSFQGPGLEIDEQLAEEFAIRAATERHFLFGTPGVRKSAGRFLYHYTSLDSLDLIRQSRSLRLSTYSTKNDPIEARPWSNLGLMYGVSELGQSPTEEVRRSADAHIAELDELRRNTLSVSFGTDSPEMLGAYGSDTQLTGFAHPSMWAHYGANHRGACVVVDRLAFDAAATQALEPHGAAFGEFVKYTASLIDMAEVPGYYVEGETASVRAELIERRRGHLFSKHPVWQSEAEYRWVCIPVGDIDQAFVPLGESVIGVVFGDQANLQDARVRAFVSDFDISANVARCRWLSPFDLSPQIVTGWAQTP